MKSKTWPEMGLLGPTLPTPSVGSVVKVPSRGLQLSLAPLPVPPTLLSSDRSATTSSSSPGDPLHAGGT